MPAPFPPPENAYWYETFLSESTELEMVPRSIPRAVKLPVMEAPTESVPLGTDTPLAPPKDVLAGMLKVTIGGTVNWPAFTGALQ